MLIGNDGAIGSSIDKKIKCKGYNISSLDINDYEKTREVIEKEKPDRIINCAVVQAIDNCEKNSELAFKTNAFSVSNLSKICNKNNIELVQLSTHAVFDGNKKEPYVETDIPIPINNYAITKYIGEIYSKNCNKHFIIRLPTVYGNYKEGYFGIVEKFIDWLEKKDKLYVSTDKLDTFTYTKDAVKQIIHIIDSKPYGIYHVCNSGYCSYYHFVLELKKLMKSKTKILKALDKDFPCLGKKSLNGSMSTNKLKPMRKWDEALKEYIEDYHGSNQR